MNHSSPFSKSHAANWLLGFALATALACSGGADMTHDAGTDVPPDDGGHDAGTDVGADGDAGRNDANVDPGACNAAAVAFPQGGTLAPGTLCDEVYACASDAAAAARIEAASPMFSCAPGSEPGSACGAYTCAYRNPGGPATLDATEIADICALTRLTPPPPLRCVVFVAAPSPSRTAP
jgi:hypothetical protein